MEQQLFRWIFSFTEVERNAPTVVVAATLLMEGQHTAIPPSTRQVSCGWSVCPAACSKCNNRSSRRSLGNLSPNSTRRPTDTLILSPVYIRGATAFSSRPPRAKTNQTSHTTALPTTITPDHIPSACLPPPPPTKRHLPAHRLQRQRPAKQPVSAPGSPP